jgi:primosomal protein N' (replication factor Y)
MALKREERFVDVAIELPLANTFCYRLPPSLCDQIRPGSLVWVPFRTRHVTGIVLHIHNHPPETQEMKEVLQLLEKEPFFSKVELTWLQWASRYYLHPLGGIIRTAFPPGFRMRSQRFFRLTEQGLDAIRKAEPASEELATLGLGERSASAASMIRRWGKARVRELTMTWQEKGWLEITESSGWPHPGLRRIRSVGLSQAGRQVLLQRELQGLRIGSRQLEILHLLDRKGELSVVGVEGIIPGARGSLQGLEKRGFVLIGYQEAQLRASDAEGSAISCPPLPTPHQKEAMTRIGETISQGAYRGFLLWGVTGSGKTEIYLQAAELCLDRGKQVLVLVPEISLTHQLVREFRSRFGGRIGILHSRLSRGERSEIWRAIHRSKISIVLGARSALFAPCHDLGLIIVDEEHDESYKQEEGFRYHARNLALMRGKLSDCVVLLGSATPSLETYYNAQKEKLACLRLPERVEGRPLPTVEVVDLRHRRKRRNGPGVFSSALQAAMEDTLEKEEQILLFLNRRGYATFLQCPDCGYVFQCRNCAVSLVYHRTEGALRCHYCGWHHPAPAVCPECRGMEVKDLGLGTETLEEAVRISFPGARVLRMDRDTTMRKHAHREILRAWRKGEADFLIGTQMIAKGHHVPNVTLVGVILADVSLNIPDFRASERTFQLMLQVAGRAGRGGRPGRVIIQTYNPHHPSIHFSVTQDYQSFARYELRAREAAGYPPFRHLVLFRVTGPDEDETATAARVVGDLAVLQCQKTRGLSCLGPSPAPILRLKGRYRWNILLKGYSRNDLHLVARKILHSLRSKLPSGRVRLTVDVDPHSFT